MATAMSADDDARATMLTMILHTPVFAQILKYAAELSLADHLSAGPCRPESVAAAAGLNPQPRTAFAIARPLVSLWRRRTDPTTRRRCLRH